MKKMVILLVLFIIVSAAGQTHKKPKTNYDPVDITVREIKSKISYNLELLEREYLTKLSYRDYIRAKDILIDSYKMLMAIPDEDEFSYDETYAISDSEFSALMSSIKNESFESDMLSVVQISAKYNYYTVSQVVRLIDMFSFSNGKLEVVKMTYPNVIDKYNSHQIINAFTYSADKEKVRQIIASFTEG
jgi:hypothetical protein